MPTPATAVDCRPAPVLALGLGEFGLCVSKYLQRVRPNVTALRPDTHLPPLLNGFRLIVAASWRPAPIFFEALEDVCRARGASFLPIVAEGARLRIGPLVAPNSGPCRRCANRRAIEADPNLALLDDVYRVAGADIGPGGFLEPYAALAAARAVRVLDDHESGLDLAGRVWTFDMLAGRVESGLILGLDGCPRCGLGRTPSERGHAHMRREIEYLWKGRQSGVTE